MPLHLAGLVIDVNALHAKGRYGAAELLSSESGFRLTYSTKGEFWVFKLSLVRYFRSKHWLADRITFTLCSSTQHAAKLKKV